MSLNRNLVLQGSNNNSKLCLSSVKHNKGMSCIK